MCKETISIFKNMKKSIHICPDIGAAVDLKAADVLRFLAEKGDISIKGTYSFERLGAPNVFPKKCGHTNKPP